MTLGWLSFWPAIDSVGVCLISENTTNDWIVSIQGQWGKVKKV